MYQPNWTSSNNEDNNYWCTAGINAAAAAAACAEAALYQAGCHGSRVAKFQQPHPNTNTHQPAVFNYGNQINGSATTANCTRNIYANNVAPCMANDQTPGLPATGAISVPTTSNAFFGTGYAPNFVKNYESCWLAAAAAAAAANNAPPIGQHTAPDHQFMNGHHQPAPVSCTYSGSGYQMNAPANGGVIMGPMSTLSTNHQAYAQESKQPPFPWMKYSGQIFFNLGVL